MNTSLNTDPRKSQFIVVNQNELNEIDLLSFFLSIFKQWRIVAKSVSVGVILSLSFFFLWPKQFELSVQLAQPEKAEIEVLNKRGLEIFTPEILFNQYYDRLRSPENLKKFIFSSEWLKKLYPNYINKKNKDILFSEFYKDVEIKVLEPKQEKWMEFTPKPSLINIAIFNPKEQEAADLLNNYITYTEQNFLDTLIFNGQHLRDLEAEKIFQQAVNLRNKHKLTRELQISRLKESLAIAERLGITKSTTFKHPSPEAINSETQIDAAPKIGQYSFLMGTEYFQAEIEALNNRKNKKSSNSQITDPSEHDNYTIKEMLSILRSKHPDDPYIQELPSLTKRLAELEQLSFDFDGGHVYRLHKAAIADGEADKPRMKIIIFGIMLSSIILGLFLAMFFGAKNKRFEQDVKPTGT